MVYRVVHSHERRFTSIQDIPTVQVCRKIDKGPKSINQVRICLKTFMSNLSFYQCLNTSEVFSLALNDSTHIWWSFLLVICKKTTMPLARQGLIFNDL